MSDKRKGKERLVRRSESDSDAKYQRNKKRVLKSAGRKGPETVQKAKEKIARLESAEDNDAKFYALNALTSAMSVWDSQIIETGLEVTKNIERGNMARNERFKKRDDFIRKLYDETSREYPGESKTARINRLRTRIIEYVNSASDDGDLEEEEWARKFLGSPDCDPNHPGKKKPILSSRSLRRVISKK
jgi:hypothetical protein